MVVLGDLNQGNLETFGKTISGGKPTLVLFHANWCGHCKMFRPEWSRVVSELSHEDGLNIAQVEHGSYGLIPEHLRMNAFPTIQIIRYGRPMANFMGTRTFQNVIKFAKQHSLSPKKEEAPKKKAKVEAAPKPKPKPKSKPLKDKKKIRPIHANGERRRRRVV